MPSDASERIMSQAARRAAGSKPVVGSSRKMSSGSPTSATPRSRRRFCPPESVFDRASASPSSPTSSITSSTSRGCSVVAGEHAVRLGDGEVRPELRVLQDDADPLAETARRARAGSKPSTSTSPPSRCAVALEDLDRRGLAGAVRPEKPKTSPRRCSKLMPRRASCSPYDLRRSRTTMALTARARACPPAERRLGAASQRRGDLAAVRLVPDDDDRVAAIRRSAAWTSAPSCPARALVECARLAEAELLAVWRARSSGLDQDRVGIEPVGAEAFAEVARLLAVPSVVSARSSSGSPGAASAWRMSTSLNWRRRLPVWACLRYVVADVFTDTPLTGNQLAVFTDARELDEEHDAEARAGDEPLRDRLRLAARGGTGTRGSASSRPAPSCLSPAIRCSGRRSCSPRRCSSARSGSRPGPGSIPVTLEREGARISFRLDAAAGPELGAVRGGRGAAGGARRALAAAGGGLRPRARATSTSRSAARTRSRRSSPTSARSSGSRRRRQLLRGLGDDAGRRGCSRRASGVAEDPATGSAAGPLAIHLSRHGRIEFGDGDRDLAGRGDRRPSKLYARASGIR